MAPAEDPDLILSSGQIPAPREIGELFNRWFEGSRIQLRAALCERLRYARLSEGTKQVTEIALVALVATLLTDVASDLLIDPVTTAAVLVTRRRLDALCAAPAPTVPSPRQ